MMIAMDWWELEQKHQKIVAEAIAAERERCIKIVANAYEMHRGGGEDVAAACDYAIDKIRKGIRRNEHG